VTGFPKPPKGQRKREKAAARRREDKVKERVRAEVDARDKGRTTTGCRYPHDSSWSCGEWLEWAHVGESRAKTRNQDPEVRHTTEGTCMLCRWAHHVQVDGHVVDVVFLTDAGCDGPLMFVSRRDGYVIGIT
jgi:hypothetical protein